jgi:hypothetical protein
MEEGKTLLLAMPISYKDMSSKHPSGWFNCELEEAEIHGVDLFEYTLIEYIPGMMTRGTEPKVLNPNIDGYALKIKRKR